jgi:surface-anchored protein
MIMRFAKCWSGRAFVPLLMTAGLAAVCLPSAGFADLTVVDMTRINININYDDQNGWELNAHDEFTDALYDADEVLLYLSEACRQTVPDDPTFDFLGAEAGDTVWVLRQRFDPARLSVGVSAEEIADGTFASHFERDRRVRSTAPWVRLTMKAVRGPGDVSVWQNDSFGRPVVWMATSDGITNHDRVFIASGLDADFNWAFTERGIYEIDFVASAFLPGEDEPVRSKVVTYTFGVEETEP